MDVAVVRAGVLDVAVERHGDLRGWPVVLLHGFPCDPAYEATERRIAGRPVITVPTVVLDAAHDGLGPRAGTGDHEERFIRLVAHRVVDGGHDLPQENPAEFVAAILSLRAATSMSSRPS
ncbi:MAG: alpha/beta fold hydrolase [Trebonia sp.]